MLEVGIWSGVMKRRAFICWSAGLVYRSSGLDGCNFEFIQPREGTEDPKQIIRPKTASVAANLRNYCHLL